MKKIFLCLVATVLFSNISFSEAFINEEVEKFINSETYLRHQNYFKLKGFVNIDKAKILPSKYKDFTGEYLAIPIYSPEKIVGIIEIVNLYRKGFLPNNDTYAINYTDYTNFDLSKRSGNIKLFDVNYFYSLHSEIIVKDNKITDWITIEVDTRFFKADVGSTNNGLYQLCDSNHNNNISFFECYSCGKKALESNEVGDWICDIPVIGWAGCWATLSSACVIVSSQY